MTREEAIERIEFLKGVYSVDTETALIMAIEALSNKPTDEWCFDCKEYDHEKHCCPRFNRVIRTTLNETVANPKEEFESADAETSTFNKETSTLGEKHQLSHGRLIDADELKKHLDGAWEELNDDGERKGVRLARWYLISAPTVDSTIVVVRCKDCQHANECHKRVQYTRNEQNTITIGYLPIE